MSKLDEVLARVKKLNEKHDELMKDADAFLESERSHTEARETLAHARALINDIKRKRAAEAVRRDAEATT